VVSEGPKKSGEHREGPGSQRAHRAEEDGGGDRPGVAGDADHVCTSHFNYNGATMKQRPTLDLVFSHFIVMSALSMRV
jgi:hypothetical protein